MYNFIFLQQLNVKLLFYQNGLNTSILSASKAEAIAIETHYLNVTVGDTVIFNCASNVPTPSSHILEAVDWFKVQF